jgi:deoxyribose-phosphate aldolase
MMDRKQLARTIDATLVQNNHTTSEVIAAIAVAEKYQVASVIAMPCYTSLIARKLANSQVMTGGVLGFPWGAECTEVKVYEALKGIKDGAEELDMVMNLGWLASGEYDAVVADLKAVKDAVGDVPLKVIIEAPILDDQRIAVAAELVMKSGAEYVKTATGFNGAATLAHVRLIKSVVGDDLLIKASGGIRTAEAAEAFIHAGASRLGIGIRSVIQILESIE